MIFRGILLLCAMISCRCCVLKRSRAPDLNTVLSKGVSSNGFVNIGPSTFLLNIFYEAKDKHEAKAKPLPPKNMLLSDIMTEFIPLDIVPELSSKRSFSDIDGPCHGACPKHYHEPRNGPLALSSLLSDTFGKIFSDTIEKPKKENVRHNPARNADDEYFMIEVIPDDRKKPIAPKPNSISYLTPSVQKNFIKQKHTKHSTAEEANKLSDFEDTDDNDIKVEEEPDKGIITDKNEVSIKIVPEDTSTVIPEMSDSISAH